MSGDEKDEEEEEAKERGEDVKKGKKGRRGRRFQYLVYYCLFLFLEAEIIGETKRGEPGAFTRIK